MVEPHMVRVLGRSAFHDTGLTSSGDLCYLGGEVCDPIFNLVLISDLYVRSGFELDLNYI